MRIYPQFLSNATQKHRGRQTILSITFFTLTEVVKNVELLMKLHLRAIRGVTCHMGSHGVTCHPTHIPPDIPVVPATKG